MAKAAAKVQKEKELGRLEEVGQELESVMNQPYVDGSSVHRFFISLKEGVIVLAGGLYYRGSIRHYYRLAPPLYKDAQGNVVTTVEHRIPTCIIRFDQFGPDAGDDDTDDDTDVEDELGDDADEIDKDVEIPENELIRRVATDGVAVFGKLYSHFWNTHQIKWLNKCEDHMRPGVWFLDDDSVGGLSQFWQKEFGKPCTFAEYCQPDYSPEKYPAI